MNGFIQTKIAANKAKTGVTLLELAIAISLLGVIAIGVASISTFSNAQVISSMRRSQMQNELSYALEYMGKYVMRGTGNVSNPPLAYNTPANDGFSVKVDINNTPSNLGDDTVYTFTLSGNTLSNDITNEVIATHILSGTSTDDTLPPSPDSGFYIKLTENSTQVEIGLVARYKPTESISLDNPQVVMKARLYTLGSGAR